MFPRSMFAAACFAPQMFPQASASAPATAPEAIFRTAPRSMVFELGSRSTVWRLAPRAMTFELHERD